MKLVTRDHRLAAAMAYEGAASEAELCAYQKAFVDEKATGSWPTLKPTIDSLERIAQAIADANPNGEGK